MRRQVVVSLLTVILLALYNKWPEKVKNMLTFVPGNSNVMGSGEDEVKKHIAIFTYKQSLLSLDMKTKVVQHVESE